MRGNPRTNKTALLRTAATNCGKNFATKRLQKDLEEIENTDIPTVGVTAHPLDDDFFVWHGNIRGPVDTVYANAVLHISITIPETYPKDPPAIELLTPITHPNVFGTTLCLDLLSKTSKSDTDTIGWSSAYTIQSLLLQLQSFFLQLTEKHN